MSISIIDGNSWFRAVMEKDISGLAIRNMYNDVQNSPNVVIYVWDGVNCNARRRALYPRYKSNRKPAPHSIQQSIDLFKQLLSMSKSINFEVPGWEADDVIATLCCKFAGQPITIYSRDSDFLQLTEIPGVTLHRPGGFPTEPHWVRLYKTLVGDSSDCIIGVPGFGPVAWEHCNKPLIQDWVQYGVGDLWAANITRRHEKWMEENRDVVKAMWTIVGFMEVPKDELEKGMTVGKPDPITVDNILREYML